MSLITRLEEQFYPWMDRVLDECAASNMSGSEVGDTLRSNVELMALNAELVTARKAAKKEIV